MSITNFEFKARAENIRLPEQKLFELDPLLTGDKIQQKILFLDPTCKK